MSDEIEAGSEDSFEGLDVQALALPDCPRCAGSGYISEEDGGALPRQYLCPCVLASRQQAVASSRVETIFGTGGARMTVSSYQTGGMEENELALACAKNYVQYWPRFKEEGAGFALQGPPGAGKTHLTTGTMIALIKRWDVKPFHLSVPEMLRLARKRFDDPKTADVLDRAMTADLYLLDDIGAEYHKDHGGGMSWVDEQLFVILNYRLTQGLPTIYTTNLSQRELRDRLDDRVSRRLATATLAFLPLKPVQQAQQSSPELKQLLLQGDGSKTVS
jgi:DNA replication protein DnaC